MFLSFLSMILIFLPLLALVYWLYKKTKGRTFSGLKRSDHIKVIDDGFQLGIGQKITVVKIGEEYFALAYGQSGVAFQKLQTNSLDKKQEKWEKEIMGEEHQMSFKELGEVYKNEE
ncbi:flagellar biosynthetic protein FliO [Bacillus mexicanus]|uniref:flagellar biosynthetic protein FliO n=1 Tax=Bacillus mexicanus TaxID=2834415 RepID=UPI003D19415E